MTDQADIRTTITTTIDAIAAAGNVYDHEVYIGDDTKLRQFFEVTVSSVVQIRGFCVGLEAIDSDMISFASNQRRYQFVAHGYMSFKDSLTADTENEFVDVVETVIDSLDNLKDASVANVIDYSIGPCSARRIDFRQFGSILVHHCEILIPVTTQRARAYA